MHIGIDCRLFSSKFTGIGRYTHELVDHLIELNRKLPQPHKITLFFNNPEFQNYKSIAPINKILVNARHYSFAEQTRFLRILNKQKCDIVHFPHFNVPIFYRRPYIVTIHDLTLSFFPGRKMIRWFHRLAYNLTIKTATRRAKKIIAVSHHTKKDLIEQLKVPADKIKVIYHGINPNFTIIADASKFEKTLKKYQITPPFLLYSGVWRYHKNLPRLIEALKILRDDKNLDLKLVITGKPDPHYPEIKETIRNLQLQDSVIFPGLVAEDELVHLYNAASIFVFPSLYEGFGLPPLESMSCGTPVVASNIASIPEICGQDNALFFDPYDVNDIASKIELLYKDSDLQAELIAKGLQHASKFTWPKMAQETFELICSNHSKNS